MVAVCALLLLTTSNTVATSSHQAALLIVYGDGSQSWVWVPFSDDTISMMDMLRSSDLDLVTVGFGGLGDAVCQIETTGCGVAECRSRMCQTTSASPFWRLLWLDDDTWRMTGSGADGTRVLDGQIVAMSWSGATPQLPLVTMADVENRLGLDPADRPSVAVARTFGKETPSSSPESWLPATGAISVVVVAAGALVYRNKAVSQVAA